MVRSIEAIKRDIRRNEDEASGLRDELALAEAMPPEPEGGIVRFSVQFGHEEPVRNFVAVRIEPRMWYLVGKDTTARHTWESLLDVMHRDVSVAGGARKLTYQVVKKWETKEW